MGKLRYRATKQPAQWWSPLWRLSQLAPLSLGHTFAYCAMKGCARLPVPLLGAQGPAREMLSPGFWGVHTSLARSPLRGLSEEESLTPGP
jgi:hypothetical protein